MTALALAGFETFCTGSLTFKDVSCRDWSTSRVRARATIIDFTGTTTIADDSWCLLGLLTTAHYACELPQFREQATDAEAAGPTVTAGIANIQADNTLLMVDPCPARGLPRHPDSMKNLELDRLASLTASNHVPMAKSCSTRVVPKDRERRTSFELARLATFTKGKQIMMITEGRDWYLSRNYVCMTVF